MKIRIIADSASDIPQETAKEWGITVLPLIIRFGQQEYLDGVTLLPDRFFELLEKGGEFPKTSQITPFTYEETFRSALEAGEDVICFCLSSGVSGSYQSACSAAAELGERVHVIDTRQFCISEYVLVERAVQLRDQGLSAPQIVEEIRREMGRVHVLAAFDTLEYLKRGGRLSAMTALAGGMLSIKPVLTIEDGVVFILGKARGVKRACDSLIELIRKYGLVDERMPFCFGYTGNSDAFLQQFASRFRETFGSQAKVPIIRVGATIGAYAGPGAVALAFFSLHPAP